MEPRDGVGDVEDPVGVGGDGREVGIDDGDPAGVGHGLAQVRVPFGRSHVDQVPRRRVEALDHRRSTPFRSGRHRRTHRRRSDDHRHRQPDAFIGIRSPRHQCRMSWATLRIRGDTIRGPDTTPRSGPDRRENGRNRRTTNRSRGATARDRVPPGDTTIRGSAMRVFAVPSSHPPALPLSGGLASTSGVQALTLALALTFGLALAAVLALALTFGLALAAALPSTADASTIPAPAASLLTRSIPC